MKEKTSGRGKLIVVTAVVVFVLTLVGIKAEKHFTTTGFCINCHSMTYPYEDLRNSVHWGSLGINPGCGDCHFPPDFMGKVKVHLVTGIKDIISEMRLDLSTREAFEAHREEFAEKARATLRDWDSSPCRKCHKDPAPASEFGRASHAAMKAQGMTCVDCHQGIFHPVREEPVETSL